MKKVLLFSGGLDSLLLEWVTKPDVLLYVDMHSSYSDKELKYVKGLPKEYTDRLVVKDFPLGEFERKDNVIPFRNVMLISLALQYGQQVYVGFTYQDIICDTTRTFLTKANKMFNEASDVRVVIDAPFHGMTKTDMVRKCLKMGMPKELIQSAHTCYDGHSDKGCGLCVPCWNKAIALINNGIFDKDLFDNPIPLKMFHDSFEEYEEKYGKGKFKSRHFKDVSRAFELIRKIQK